MAYVGVANKVSRPTFGRAGAALSYISEAVDLSPLCAYGVQKLVASYDGPCIQIKRDSDGATKDIGFAGKTMDLDTADTFAPNGYKVITIYEQSGSGAANLDISAFPSPIRVRDGVPHIWINDNTGATAALPETLDAPATMLAITLEGDGINQAGGYLYDSATSNDRVAFRGQKLFEAGSTISAAPLKARPRYVLGEYDGASSILRANAASSRGDTGGNVMNDLLFAGSSQFSTQTVTGVTALIFWNDGISAKEERNLTSQLYADLARPRATTYSGFTAQSGTWSLDSEPFTLDSTENSSGIYDYATVEGSENAWIRADVKIHGECFLMIRRGSTTGTSWRAGYSSASGEWRVEVVSGGTVSGTALSIPESISAGSVERMGIGFIGATLYVRLGDTQYGPRRFPLHNRTDPYDGIKLGISANDTNAEYSNVLVQDVPPADSVPSFPHAPQLESTNSSILEGGSNSDSDSIIREPGNVLFDPEAPDNEKYKWYYTGTETPPNDTERIHLAVSPDGWSWEKRGPITALGEQFEDPYVLKKDGDYYMFVEDKVGDLNTTRLSSADGLSWTIDGDIGVTAAQSPTVIFDGDKWVMLYEPFGSNSTRPPTVTYAENPDFGLKNWTVPDDINPVIDTSALSWAPDVALVVDDLVYINGKYYMSVHTGDVATPYIQGAIYSSPDLIDWTFESGPFSWVSQIQFYNQPSKNARPESDRMIHWAEGRTNEIDSSDHKIPNIVVVQNAPLWQ